MKIKSVVILTFFMVSFHNLMGSSLMINSMSMDTLPFYEIPAEPVMYNAATVTARMVEGLGYRYHWATKDLRPEDHAYEPGNDGQNCAAVLEHILGLSRFVLRTVKKEMHDNAREYPELDWPAQREETLMNLKLASEILRGTGDVSEFKIIFKRGEKTSEFPYWNLLNGPLADAIYHTGQIVSYRRSSGNPINPNVSVFRGKTRL